MTVQRWRHAGQTFQTCRCGSVVGRALAAVLVTDDINDQGDDLGV